MKLKGVVHIHSNYSYDAKLSLVELKELFINEGLSFACMTEHTNEMDLASAEAFVSECRALSDDSFVFVPGFEVPYFQAGMERDTHVLMIGATEFVGQWARDAQSLRDWASRAALVVLAHPVRNHFTIDETLTELIDAVEIWNQHYDGRHAPRTKSVELLRRLRAEKEKLLATGALDLHRVEHLTFPRSTIEAPSLSEASIIQALVEGSYTFGTDTLSVYGKGPNEAINSLSVRTKSRVAVIVIGFSKWLTKALKKWNIKLPNNLKKAIRSRV